MIINADVLRWAADYDGPPFHAVLCDPPYELAFMGKHWDAAGVAFKPETWAAIARHVHPGGFIMAFGGSRTYHRLACAMEDAGLIIHPAVGWMFGSGFPKATRVKDTPDFDGHRYGLQALKPAFEFVCVAQVPYRGRPVESITATGAGALWIDGGRVPTGDSWTFVHGPKTGRTGGGIMGEPMAREGVDQSHPAGRWPPNFVLTHVPPRPMPMRRLHARRGPAAGLPGVQRHGHAAGLRAGGGAAGAGEWRRWINGEKRVRGWGQGAGEGARRRRRPRNRS